MGAPDLARMQIMEWEEFVALLLLGILAGLVVFILYNGITL